MRNRKQLTALVMTGIMAASTLTACSGNSGNNGGGQPQQGTEATASQEKSGSGDKVKITVWTENRHDLEYMNKKVEEFNNSNDHIEIEYVAQTENFVNLLTMAANSGQSPDIFSAINPTDFKNFAEGGMIQPLNNYITDEFRTITEIDEHQYEGSNVLGDDIYWIPCGKRSGSRFIYNKEIFDELGLEVPAKLSDLPGVVKTITEAGNGEYYGIIFPGASSPFERWLEHSAEMSGITPYNYAEGKYDFSGFKPYLETVRQMFEENSVFPGSSSMKIDPVRVQFSEGHVGIHANASQEATVLTEQFPAQIEWAVAPLPTIDGEIKGKENCSPNFGWMMSAMTEHPQEAYEVIEYFGSESLTKGYFEGGYTLPMSSYMEERIDSSKVGRMSDFSGADYEAVLPIAPSVSPEGENYQDALWNACLPEGPSIDETIEKLNQSYNAALDRDVKMGKTKRLMIKDYDPLNPGDGTATYLEE